MPTQTKLDPFQQLRAVAVMFFRAMVGAYGLNITLHVLAFILIGDQWVIIEFLNTFAHLLWLPTVVLIPVCLIAREWRLVIMMLPGLIAFLIIWGGMFIPPQAPVVEKSDQTFRVFSHNLYAGNEKTDVIVDAIRTVNADIVVLQELIPLHAETLAETFRQDYPHRAFHPVGGTVGQGVMSRYPIIEDDFWQFDFLPRALGHQRVAIELSSNTVIALYNVHPSHPGMQGDLFNTAYRSREIRALLEEIAGETIPVIFAGDFNMPDLSHDYRLIREQLGDAFRSSGFGMGWTFPSTRFGSTTFLRLDYIFHTPDITPLKASVHSAYTGSDHLGLYADFVIQSQQE